VNTNEFMGSINGREFICLSDEEALDSRERVCLMEFVVYEPHNEAEINVNSESTLICFF
jgi:hypothetical protein